MELTLYRGPRGLVYGADTIQRARCLVYGADTIQRAQGLVYGADTIQRAQGPFGWSGHYTEGLNRGFPLSPPYIQQERDLQSELICRKKNQNQTSHLLCE